MRTLRFVILATCLGCGGGLPSAESPDSIDLRDPVNFYPLSEGNVWSYNIETDAAGSPVLSIARASSVTAPAGTTGNRFAVSANNGDPMIYEVRPDGIFRVSTDTWLLRAPLTMGESWASGAGRTAHVTATGRTVDTNAGSFDNCVQVEERDQDSTTDTERSITTVYCPGVGPVIVESRVTLRLTGQETFAIGRILGYQLARH